MIVYRPYLQTNLFNFFVGVLVPILFSLGFYFLLRSPDFPQKIYLTLSFPLFVVGGLYFLFSHCVWKIVCDDERGILFFHKTFYRVIFRVIELNEMNVFKNFRGFDYRFKTSRRQITVEEMDEMQDLVTYIRRMNPQIDVSSPEDHTLF